MRLEISGIPNYKDSGDHQEQDKAEQVPKKSIQFKLLGLLFDFEGIA
jgi:hypothetical protein